MNVLDKLTTEAPDLIKWISEKGMEYGFKLLLALVVLFVGFRIIKLIIAQMGKLMVSNHMSASLSTFLRSFVGIILKILVIITALSIAGVEMTIFVAIMTALSAGFAFAMNGTLSNFFGGAMILLFRPYEVGDFITSQGFSGTVKEVQIFFTILTTPDNKTILIPNGKLSNDALTNYSKQETRRVEWSFGIAYGNSYDTAKDMIVKFIQDDSRILKDPEPFIGLGALADSSVNITVRVWTIPSDYWPVFFDMNERFYKEADAHGLSIPFPQLDVHLNQVKS